MASWSLPEKGIKQHTNPINKPNILDKHMFPSYMNLVSSYQKAN